MLLKNPRSSSGRRKFSTVGDAGAGGDPEDDEVQVIRQETDEPFVPDASDDDHVEEDNDDELDIDIYVSEDGSDSEEEEIEYGFAPESTAYQSPSSDATTIEALIDTKLRLEKLF